MFRIDGPGAVGELPPVREGVSDPGFFGPGNPATGQMSTRVTYEWLNAVQEELANVILSAGLELSKNANDQLRAAIGALIDSSGETFTPPTSSAPGTAGLVPAPAATPANDIPQFFLGKDAVWRSLAEAGFGIDFATLDKNRIVWGVQTLVGDHDPDTITSGIYFLNSNSLVPSPYNGLLMTFVERQSNDSPLYALIQIFFTYLNSYYRTVTGPIRRGEAPTASQWGPWVSLSAPHPTTADSLGQWIGLSASGFQITLPPGGAWAYFITGARSDGILQAHAASVAAGGTVVSLHSSVVKIGGFAYRVA